MGIHAMDTRMMRRLVKKWDRGWEALKIVFYSINLQARLACPRNFALFGS